MRRERFEISLVHPRGHVVLAVERQHVRRVGTLEHRVEEPAVEVPVAAPRRLPVGLPVGPRVDGVEVEGDADAGAVRAELAKRADGQRVRAKEHVAGLHRRPEVLQPRRVHAVRVARERGHPWLVQRHPDLHAVAEVRVQAGRVLRKPRRGVAVGPPAGVLQRLRQVPVIERERGLDTGRQERVHQRLVEIEARAVGLPPALREHARPGGGEAVGGQAQVPHVLHVVAPAVVVVAGRVAGVAAVDRARDPAEPVPDRLAAAIIVHRAFDLIGCGRRTPEEPSRKLPAGHSCPPVTSPDCPQDYSRSAPTINVAWFHPAREKPGEDALRDPPDGARRRGISAPLPLLAPDDVANDLGQPGAAEGRQRQPECIVDLTGVDADLDVPGRQRDERCHVDGRQARAQRLDRRQPSENPPATPDIDAHFLKSLTQSDREQVRVARLGATAGERDVTRPRIALPLGTPDEEDLRESLGAVPPAAPRRRSTTAAWMVARPGGIGASTGSSIEVNRSMRAANDSMAGALRSRDSLSASSASAAPPR